MPAGTLLPSGPAKEVSGARETKPPDHLTDALATGYPRDKA